MRSKKLRRLLLVGLALSVIGGLTPLDAVAYDSDDYAAIQDKINETRAKIRRIRAQEKAILGEIAASDQRLSSLESSLASITDQLLLATRRLQLLELQHEKAAIDLQLKTAELERATIALDNTTNRLRDRAMNIYMNGTTAYVSVLLNANDFHGYVAGMQYAENVLHVDMDIVEEIRGLKSTVEAQHLALENHRKALEVQANEVAAQYARLAGLRSQQAGAKSAVQAEIDYKEHLLARVRREKRAYAEALQSYLEESDSIAEMLRRAQDGQHAIQGKGGYLKWPVSGPITSDYGWRTHPIYGYKSFHTGIDIGASSGKAVKAARKGEVLYVGTKGAYGLVVIVDHGNAVATMYAHLSKSYVHPGQAVGTLATIAAVGCTGWCTGPHVHFEVRVNGEPQNPHHWL
ncbi:MAG: murein hydrolase activator EnvC family protein [Actinomycetota bacterium]